MIKIENTKVTGWEAAIRGMRNPNARDAFTISAPVTVTRKIKEV